MLCISHTIYNNTTQNRRERMSILIQKVLLVIGLLVFWFAFALGAGWLIDWAIQDKVVQHIVAGVISIPVGFISMWILLDYWDKKWGMWKY